MGSNANWVGFGQFLRGFAEGCRFALHLDVIFFILPRNATTTEGTVGAISDSCESVTEIFRRLYQQAGVINGNASSARRTFAVMLHRQGRSPKLIQYLIGMSSLSAVKRLVESDPVRLATIVSGVI
uniref:Uncharacterized protein n=2 Tax=Ralstonia solanacearum TaxID=305 RepID=D8P5Y4_RALSL|nr:protein of unknown function [Ralstonia solanacearum CFBP2957]